MRETSSSLDPGHRDPLDEQPLGQEEHKHHRQHDDQRCGHQVGPVDLEAAAEEVQAQGQGVAGLVLQVDQGRQEVVPTGLEGEDDDGRQRRASRSAG